MDNLNNKIVVIDSLARSGTTMLAAIIRSQNNAFAYRGCFHEPLTCQYAGYPHGLVCHHIFEDSDSLSIKPQGLKSIIRRLGFNKVGKDLEIDWHKMQTYMLKKLGSQKFSQTDINLFKKILAGRPGSVTELDEKYQQLAQSLEARILCFRWNQGLPYYKKWLRNPNHYWLAIVRNPMSRACSARKSHNWTWEQSIECSKWFAKNLERAVQHPKVSLTYYEDLVADAQGEIKKLFNFLEYEPDYIELENLVGQDGLAYRSETVDNIQDGKSHKDGKVTKGIYAKAVERYKEEMPDDILDHFTKELSDYKIYRRYFTSN